MRLGDVDQPRLRRVVDLIRESGIHSQSFQVFGTRFFDESDLSHIGLGQSGRFPAWPQRTGSAVRDVSEGGKRPGGPQAVTPSSKRLRHTGNHLRQLVPVCCRHGGNGVEGPD